MGNLKSFCFTIMSTNARSWRCNPYFGSKNLLYLLRILVKQKREKTERKRVRKQTKDEDREEANGSQPSPSPSSLSISLTTYHCL